MRVRRSAYVVFYAADGRFLDVELLLRGVAKPAALRQLFACSLLTGEPQPISRETLAWLLDLPADDWREADGGAAPVDAPVEELARQGLVVTDDADPELAELRRREEALATTEWNLYAAVYHFMTRWEGVDTGVPATGDEIGELAGPARTSGATAVPPDPFLRHEGAASVELPLGRPRGELYELLARRRTTRAFDADASLALDELSVLLRAVFGCHGFLRPGNDVVLLRKTSPSGGALHPVEVYPVIRAVDDLAPGLYHYDPGRHAVELLRELDGASVARLAGKLAAGQRYAESAAALFVLTGRFYRSFWKYRRHEKAYGALLMDAGHLSQTFYLVCTDLGLGAMVTAAVNNREVEDALGLDPYAEGSLALLACGRRLGGPSPLEPEFRPYIPRETAI